MRSSLTIPFNNYVRFTIRIQRHAVRVGSHWLQETTGTWHLAQITDILYFN